MAKCIYCGKPVTDPYDSFCSDSCCNNYGSDLKDFDPEACDPFDVDDPAPM